MNPRYIWPATALVGACIVSVGLYLGLRSRQPVLPPVTEPLVTAMTGYRDLLPEAFRHLGTAIKAREVKTEPAVIEYLNGEQAKIGAPVVSALKDLLAAACDPSGNILEARADGLANAVTLAADAVSSQKGH